MSVFLRIWMKRLSNDTFDEGLNWRSRLHIFLFPVVLQQKNSFFFLAK